MWESHIKIMPSVQKEVSERFKDNSQIVLDKAEGVVKFLEEVHRRIEPSIDIYNDKRGSVAAFILHARVISLLYSIIHLLRSGIPSESFILFRPLWEAILLSKYFILSEINGDNIKEVREWFEKNQSPSAGAVRFYYSEKLNFPIDSLKDLNNGSVKLFL